MENQISTSPTPRPAVDVAVRLAHANPSSSFTLGDFQVDVSGLKLVLISDQSARKITFKGMRVLLELSAHAGQTRTRDQLLDAVWPDTCPTPDVLTQAIKELRKALHDDQKAPEYIETIPKMGYRLLKSADAAVPTAAIATALLIQSSEPSEPLAALSIQPAISTAASPSRLIFLWLLLLIATLLGLTLIWMRGVPAQKITPLSALTAPLKIPVRMLTSSPGIEATPVLSPNGEWLAYVAPANAEPLAPERIWIRDLSTPNAQRLTSDDATGFYESAPNFSADGLTVAFARYDPAAEDSGTPCAIWAQRVLGGVPRKLLDCPAGALLPFDWPTPERLLLPIKQLDKTNKQSNDVPSQSVGIFSFDLKTGSATRIASKPGNAVYDWFPKVSPDGLKLAFRRGGNTDSTLMVADADGANAKAWAQLAHGARGFDWLPGSDSILVSVLATAKYELAIVRPNQAMQFLGVAGQMPSASQSGQVSFSVPQERIGLLRFDLDSDLPGTIIFPSTQADASPSLSPDGEQLAFLSDRAGSYQIWLGKPGDSPQAITQVDARFSNISWHPSGQRFMAAQLRPGQMNSELLEYDLARGALKIVAVPNNFGLIVRVSFDVDPDYLLILSSQNGHRILQRFAWPIVSDSTWQADWTLHDIGSFQRDAISQKLYFTRVANNTLFTQASDSTVAVAITPFQPQWLWSWRVQDGQVYYSSRTETGFALHQRTLASGVDTVIRDMGYGDLALDLDRRRAIVPSSLSFEMDIGSIKLR